MIARCSVTVISFSLPMAQIPMKAISTPESLRSTQKRRKKYGSIKVTRLATFTLTISAAKNGFHLATHLFAKVFGVVYLRLHLRVKSFGSTSHLIWVGCLPARIQTGYFAPSGMEKIRRKLPDVLVSRMSFYTILLGGLWRLGGRGVVSFF